MLAKLLMLFITHKTVDNDVQTRFKSSMMITDSVTKTEVKKLSFTPRKPENVMMIC